MLKKLAILGVLCGIALGVMLLTTRNSHYEVKTQRHLAQPPAEVWSRLAEVERWPRWWPGVERAALAERLSRGALIELRLTGRPEEDPARVIRFEPGSTLFWQRPGVFGSRAGVGFVLQSTQTGAQIQIITFIDGPQAFLARFTGREAFASYQQKVLDALEEVSVAGRVAEQEKD